MLNVLIAEDDVHISIHLSNMINSENVRCMEILNDGTRVYQRLKELNPDVLILDLKMPGKNGIEILKDIDSDSKIKTRILIYSGEMAYLSMARNFKCIDKYYSKTTPAEEIGRELEKMADELTYKNIENQIQEILFKMGFTYTLKGTRLIAECILYAVLNNEENIAKIYEIVARRNHENTNTIKSDIHTSIKNMWRYTDKARTKKILRLAEYDKPSCKGIISMVKYYIER